MDREAVRRVQAEGHPRAGEHEQDHGRDRGRGLHDLSGQPPDQGERTVWERRPGWHRGREPVPIRVIPVQRSLASGHGHGDRIGLPDADDGQAEDDPAADQRESGQAGSPTKDHGGGYGEQRHERPGDAPFQDRIAKGQQRGSGEDGDPDEEAMTKRQDEDVCRLRAGRGEPSGETRADAPPGRAEIPHPGESVPGQP